MKILVSPRSLLALTIAAVLGGCTVTPIIKSRGKGTILEFETTVEKARQGILDAFADTGLSKRYTRGENYLKASGGVTHQFYFDYDEKTRKTKVECILRHVILTRGEERAGEEAMMARAYFKLFPEKAQSHPEPFVRQAAIILAAQREEAARKKREQRRAQAARVMAPAPPAPRAQLPAPSSDVDAPALPQASERIDDFALIVGIEDYRRVPKAKYAERDAHTVKRYVARLGVPEENIILLTGKDATLTGIRKYLEEWLPRNVTPQSRVYVYYSGHGAPDPERGTAYLLPWDGDPSFLKTTGYPLGKLYSSLRMLKAKEILVMLDACFSGAGGRSVIADGTRPLVTIVDTKVPAGGKVSVLSAASGSEVAGSLNEQGHGMFTYYMLKGLSGAADGDGDGRVSLKELHAYTKKHVQRAARRQNREQTPTLSGKMLMVR